MENNCQATYCYDPVYHLNIYVCVCNATGFEIEDFCVLQLMCAGFHFLLL